MKNKLVEITKIINKTPCHTCDGTDKTCKKCNGTGIVENYHYNYIHNGICFNMDTLK